MAKQKNLATMSLDALMKLRDDVTEMLGNQAVAIQEQLARLTDLGTGGKNSRAPKPNKLKGRTVAVKYRDKNGNTWSGRGVQPRWMTAAIKAGAKRDDFLVGRTAAKKTTRKARPAKKAKRVKRRAKARKPAKKRVVRSKAAKRSTKKLVAKRRVTAEVSPAPASSSQS